MNVKCDLLLLEKRINYGCLKVKCSGKYLYLRIMMQVNSLGYCMVRNFVLYCTVRIMKSRRLHVGRMKKMNPYRILVGAHLGKQSLGSLRRRWENNIKVNLKETDCKEGRWCNWLRIMSSGRLWY